MRSGGHGASGRPRDQGVRRVLTLGVAAVVVALAAATVLATFARELWLADLAVHFRLQYAALAVLAACVLLWTGRRSLASAAAVVALLNGLAAAPVLGWLPPVAQARSAAAAAEVPLRVVAINVLYTNRRHGRVIELIRAERPDAVVLVEVTPGWLRALEKLRGEYPYTFHRLDTRGHGAALLSRHPLARVQALHLAPGAEPGVMAELDVAGRTVHLFGVHASWPMTPRSAASRNRELAELAAITRGLPSSVIVLGDLNVTSFSPHFQQLLSAGRLRSAAAGFGWQPSWPALVPLAGIQIDHALVSPDVRVAAFRVGPYVGSDHRPVVVDLAL